MDKKPNTKDQIAEGAAGKLLESQLLCGNLGEAVLNGCAGIASRSPTSIVELGVTNLSSAMDLDTPEKNESQPKLFMEVEGTDREASAENALEAQDICGSEESGEDDNACDTVEPAPVRIPYNNGFGDFFFEPLKKGWPETIITEDMSIEQKNELLGIEGSNGVPVIELDNFQRYKPTQNS
jgi:hypothetical protein